MIIRPQKLNSSSTYTVEIPTSKSISNRLLILNALADDATKLIDLSESEDTKILTRLLKSELNELNAGMAGTAYRFMLAYLSLMGEDKILTGHQRMLERPISPLVEALKILGANINYLGQDGFPPLQIKPSKLRSAQLEIDGSMSSQFISALMMIAPLLDKGLRLNFKGELVSRPYVEMTADLMANAKIELNLSEDFVEIKAGRYELPSELKVEKDWSSAAFFYAYFALSDLSMLMLNGLDLNSIQGDKACAVLFKLLGVNSEQQNEGVLLTKIPIQQEEISVNMIEVPDLIPPFVVAAAFLQDTVKISGISTLFHKESNRVVALQTELKKLGIKLDYDRVQLRCQKVGKLPENIKIEHYNDHRIAMSFSVLVAKGLNISLSDESVVNKSFPKFWTQMDKFSSVYHSAF